MKYEIYIQESKKSQKFCKKAIAEYEKRLSRYCKISCKFIKKEKEWESLLVKDTGMKKFIVLHNGFSMVSGVGEESFFILFL